MVKHAKRGLPVSAMERVLREAGAERVAAGAKEALGEALHKNADVIARRAVEFSRHAGRKTVLAQDVRRATER